MTPLHGKRVAIVGGSEGVGREMVREASEAGASVLAVARREEPLRALERDLPGVTTLSADMTDETMPSRMFAALRPDVVVVSAGATPPMTPIHELDWRGFTQVWENDVRGSFNVVKAALNQPLAPGSTVAIVSSGAGLVGSPLSGGYAGAKRMQMFMAQYAQEESDRRSLGIRFLSLVPRFIMAGTPLGTHAAEGYAKYRGVTVAGFLSRFPQAQSARDVAHALVTLLSEVPAREGTVFAVDALGISTLD